MAAATPSTSGHDGDGHGRDGDAAIDHYGTRDRRIVRHLAAINEELEQLVEERTRCVRLLQQVTMIANGSDSVEPAIHRTLALICRQLGWPAGHAYLADPRDEGYFVDSGIWWLEDADSFADLVAVTSRTRFRAGDGLVGRVLATAAPVWVPDVEAEQPIKRVNALRRHGVRSALLFPIMVQTRVAGVLECFGTSKSVPDDTLLETVVQLGTQLGRVIERKALERRLSDLVEQDHRMIGQDLHDSVGQELTGIGMLARTLQQRLAARGDPEAERAAALVQGLQRATSQVRTISRGLVPVEVDADGLRLALETLVERTRSSSGVDCRFECDGAAPVEDTFTATNLFRIAQEAVNNAVRHGAPGLVQVRLDSGRDQVELEIRDDGSGFDPDGPHRGMGLRIMRHRASLVGGAVEIEMAEQGGTVIRCTAPQAATDQGGSE